MARVNQEIDRDLDPDISLEESISRISYLEDKKTDELEDNLLEN